MKQVVSATVLVALLCASIGVVLANSPDADNCGDEEVICGCYHESTGALRIVEDCGECLPSEQPISCSVMRPE